MLCKEKRQEKEQASVNSAFLFNILPFFYQKSVSERELIIKMREKCKYNNCADWLTAILGLFLGAIGMVSVAISIPIAYDVLILRVTPSFTISDYIIFARGPVMIAVSGVMFTNNIKFRKNKRVSTVPYFVIILFFIGEIILILSTGSLTVFELVVRGFFPIVAFLAFISIKRRKQFRRS